MAQRKVESTLVGHNVKANIDGDFLTLGIDLSKSLGQTKGSKEAGKLPNEMVGTTKTYAPIPGTNCKLMLHLIRPMDLDEAEASRKKTRALNEMAEEDATEAEVTPAQLKKILAMLNKSS